MSCQYQFDGINPISQSPQSFQVGGLPPNCGLLPSLGNINNATYNLHCSDGTSHPIPGQWAGQPSFTLDCSQTNPYIDTCLSILEASVDVGCYLYPLIWGAIIFRSLVFI